MHEESLGSSFNIICYSGGVECLWNEKTARVEWMLELGHNMCVCDTSSRLGPLEKRISVRGKKNFVATTDYARTRYGQHCGYCFHFFGFEKKEGVDAIF